jgi:hypothetical protein
MTGEDTRVCKRVVVEALAAIAELGIARIDRLLEECEEVPS